MKELKLRDVYSIWYIDSKNNSRHCFEGLGVVVENSKGEKFIQDTFWQIGHYRSDEKNFTVEDIGVVIDVEYYVNLDDIEPIDHYHTKYYSDDDLFRITRQHGCTEGCIHRYKRKGAKRSPEKMKSYIQQQIKDAEWQYESAKRDLERYKEKLESFDSQNIDEMYI